MSLFSLFKPKNSSGIFIPDGKGFRELAEPVAVRNIKGIAEHLGYHVDQIDAYRCKKGTEDQGIHNVITEIFSGKTIFVFTMDHVTNLSGKMVGHFMKDYQLAEVFDTLHTKIILDKGIKNRSLDIGFLSRVLNIPDPADNGVFFVERLNFYLYFSDGKLESYQSANGLNEWGNHFREYRPDLLEAYKKEAALFWGNDLPKILNEINRQAEAWSLAPGAAGNKFVHLHKSKEGNVNFVMLCVAHYGYLISLTDFLTINHGRYRQVSSLDVDVTVYAVGQFDYSFLGHKLVGTSVRVK